MHGGTAISGIEGVRKDGATYGSLSVIHCNIHDNDQGVETGGVVRGVSVKTPLADPAHDPIVVGTFTFRRASDFAAAAQAMIARDGRINGEFYVDSCIEDAIALGLRVRVFEIEHYLCWGTPVDLRTFEYWQRCFDRWPSHPYRFELDSRCSRTTSLADAAVVDAAAAGIAKPLPA